MDAEDPAYSHPLWRFCFENQRQHHQYLQFGKGICSSCSILGQPNIASQPRNDVARNDEAQPQPLHTASCATKEDFKWCRQQAVT